MLWDLWTSIICELSHVPNTVLIGNTGSHWAALTPFLQCAGISWLQVTATQSLLPDCPSSVCVTSPSYNLLMSPRAKLLDPAVSCPSYAREHCCAVASHGRPHTHTTDYGFPPVWLQEIMLHDSNSSQGWPGFDTCANPLSAWISHRHPCSSVCPCWAASQWIWTFQPAFLSHLWPFGHNLVLLTYRICQFILLFKFHVWLFTFSSVYWLWKVWRHVCKTLPLKQWIKMVWRNWGETRNLVSSIE